MDLPSEPPNAQQQPTFSIGTFTTPPPSSFISACAASSKFILLGLSNGTLSLYDVFGNLLDSHPNLHVGPIAAVALGASAFSDQVIASVGRARHDIRTARMFVDAGDKSSSKGGPVLNKMLTGATVAIAKHAEHDVTHLAIDPNFGRPRFGDRVAYVEEGRRVVIQTAGWFGGTEVVVADNIAATDLKWVHYLLAYAYKDGVKVHDTRSNRPVCVVAPPGSTAPASPIMSPRRIAETFREVSDETEGTETSRGTSKAEGEEQLEEDKLWQTDDQKREGEECPHGVEFEEKPSAWAMKTRIFMQVDESVPLSPHGEPTILLYVTWPTGARIVQIGALEDTELKDQTPQRDIEVIFKLERPDVFLQDVYSSLDLEADALHEGVLRPEEAPLLSLVPFGEQDTVALVGTPSKGLAVHLISSSTGRSEKNMAMPHTGVCDAEMLTIPGGDPLVLIVGHWTCSPISSRGKGKDEEKSRNGQELIFVRSLTTAERVKWLLGQSRFSDALHIAQSAPGASLRRAEVSLEDIGEQFLESLQDSGNYSKLASVLPETITATTPYFGNNARDKVMRKRIKRWEKWIRVFRETGNVATLAPFIPTYEPCLPEQSYNRILVELAATNPTVMLEVLKTWPADVFGVSTVTKAIEEQLAADDGDIVADHDDKEPLREGLLMMYGLSGRHDETLNLLLRGESPKVYDYIRSHHLYEAIRSQETISGLYNIDPSAATDILSHAPETVLPPEAVVPILSKVNRPEWMFMYLHAVFRMDVEQATKYHNMLLKLYIEYGSPGMLFNFLRTSSHYSLDRALREMGGPKGFKRGELADERVYVLSAMGDLNSAMDILLEEQADTFAAIEFASDHGDAVLWERLIEHARTHADTLAALLDSPAGGKVDPVRLIPLLTSEMRIPHLRDRLHRILVDAALERSLREDAAAALHHDASELLQSLDESVSTMPA
eukprot:GFKZ01014369.1.p1 GENE.GFKZ01014369.1~~GFKZ01014369.1.p1  ORF type:complete len:948 (-),score=149.31 GFKZ01014369.1:989-3832(-)